MVNSNIVEIQFDKNNASGQRKAIFYLDNEQDLIQRWICTNKDFYERPILDFVSDIIPSGGVFIDVGANIGNHSIFFGVAHNAEVYAFEPNRPNNERMVRNFELSGLLSKAHSFLAAVGASKSTVRSCLLEGSENSGGAKVSETNVGDPEAVPLLRLDDALAKLIKRKASNVLVKIDVEGMEVEVLKGMQGLINGCRPIIICEISSDKNIVLVRNMLADKGYIVGACFFKSSTFVIIPQEIFPTILPKIIEPSWQTARTYVEYCRLAKIFNYAKKNIAELHRWFL